MPEEFREKDYRLGAQLKRGNISMRLLISEDAVYAYLVVDNCSPGDTIHKSEIYNLIKESGIKQGVVEENIENFINEFNQNPQKGKRVLIAKGQEAINGKDGYIEYYVDVKQEKKNEKHRKDMREVSHIINVKKGEKIGKLVPPTPAQDGIDIFGNIINAKDGKPCQIKAGKNVKFDPDTGIFYAEEIGRLIIDGKFLSIDTEYTVQGNVDYSVGVISFVGKVVITGDVLPGFNVYGGMGVQINGIVEAADISSEKDIIIKGGVHCKKKSSLKCGGNFSSKFIKDGYLECKGDVNIDNEISTSEVKTLGWIRIPKGTIMGSNVIALKGIEAGSIGSDLGVATTVTVGINYKLEEEMKQIEEEIEKLIKEQEKIEKSIKPIISNPQMMKRLSTSKRVTIKKLLQQIKQIVEKTEQLRKIQQEKRENAKKDAGKEMIVYNILYPSTIIIGQCRRQIKEPVRGPILLKEDWEEDTVRIEALKK